jgi:predicted O-methyltransferase YrrM
MNDFVLDNEITGTVFRLPRHLLIAKTTRIIQMRNWNSDSILNLSRAFMESRLLLSGAEIDVFTHLSSPKTLDEITSLLESDRRATEILLDALTAMKLLEKEDERYHCPEPAASLLSSESEHSVRPMILHSASVWQRWSLLSDVVRTGNTAAPPAGLFEKEELTAFIFAMHVVGRHMADEIAVIAKAQASRALLDVGGATGTYAEAFLNQYPEMRATLFDRPAVIEMAETRLASSPVRKRITLSSGDFYTDPLPAGHDLVLLSAIIHQNSPEQNVALYKKCFDALTPRGRLLVRDHVMQPDRVKPEGGALFAVNMLVATEGGNCYTFEDIRSGLYAVGFVNARQIRDGGRMDGLVEAYKP